MPCLPQENQACGEKLLLVDVHLLQDLLSHWQNFYVHVLCMYCACVEILYRVPFVFQGTVGNVGLLYSLTHA